MSTNGLAMIYSIVRYLQCREFTVGINPTSPHHNITYSQTRSLFEPSCYQVASIVIVIVVYMSDVGFDVVVLVLSLLYGGFLILFALQLDTRKWQRLSELPGLSTQQFVIITCTLFCIVRTAFFLVSTYSWNASVGLIGHSRGLFILLDQTSHALFLNIMSAVILFWAKIFSTASQQINTYTRFVYPMILTSNALAIIMIVIVNHFERDSHNSGVSGNNELEMLVVLSTSALLVAAYLITAATLYHYISATASEFEQVPMSVGTRVRRISSLKKTGYFLAAVLICRCVALLCLADKPIRTITAGELVLMFMCYVLLELLPLYVLFTTYRIQSQGREREHCLIFSTSPGGGRGGFRNGDIDDDDLACSTAAESQHLLYGGGLRGTSPGIENVGTGTCTDTDIKGHVHDNGEEQQRATPRCEEDSTAVNRILQRLSSFAE